MAGMIFVPQGENHCQILPSLRLQIVERPHVCKCSGWAVALICRERCGMEVMSLSKVGTKKVGLFQDLSVRDLYGV